MVGIKEIDSDIYFKEMFLRVGEKYPNKELTDRDMWYTLRSWTKEEEKSFKEWMIKYMTKKERVSKKKAKEEVSFFLFQYGWTTKEELGLKTIRR